MSYPFDKRFKVDEDMLKRFIELKKKGISYRQIGKGFGVHPNTVRYWLNSEYRKKQRDTIKKRKCSSKARMLRAKDTKNKFIEEYALGYINKEVMTYKWSKKDVKILGISMRKHWIPYLKKKFKRGKRKLGL